MPTLTAAQRAQISRANGAKSRGPKTEEGKAASSRNAIRTGEHAHQILDFLQPHLAAPPGGLDALFKELTAVYRPAHAPAESLVRDIATVRWQIDRYNACIGLVWAHALPCTEASVASNVAAAIDIFGANAVVTRLSREVARLHRQLIALERQLLFVHKHFAPPPAPAAVPEPRPEEPPYEPQIIAPEVTLDVITYYRREYPFWRIVVLPTGEVALDGEYDRSLEPRRAA